MQVSITTKIRAIEEVDEKGRLIGDVAAEFGISKRKLFNWLKQAKTRTEKKSKQYNEIKFLQDELNKIQLRLAEINQEIEKERTSHKASNDSQHFKIKATRNESRKLKQVS